MRVLIATGQVSAREVLDAHLGAIDSQNPTINAVCTLSRERAFQDANRADQAFARGESLGLLHGVPILHKDLLDTAGVTTTYGSRAFAQHVPDVDSLIVARTAAAGAVMLGKTNTPQFGTGGHTTNQLFGTTLNPHDVSRTAGGSSGGSAAALAARMAPLATGTDMAGSLRIPAAFCGVVGLRPSPGRIPWWPASSAQIPYVVAGPMARTVTDVALLLSATAGPDPRADLSLPEPGSVFGAEHLGLEPGRLKVAWAPQIGGLPVAPEVAGVLARIPEVLACGGVEVTEAEPDLAGAEEAFRVWRAWYYAESFGALLRERPDVLDEFTAANVREGLALQAVDLERADALKAALTARTDAFFAEYDALLMPCAPVLPFSAERRTPETIDGSPLASYLDWMRHLFYITATGLPAVSLPAGLAEGLPVGVQIVTGPGRDLEALQLARLLEIELDLSADP